MSLEHDNDELKKLEHKPHVLAPEGDFEAPAKEVIPGPYYMAADERMPELEADEPSMKGATLNSKGKPFPVGRRDFMRLFSASAMFGATACVRRPAETAIPYVKQPVDQVPGVATHYATTCGDCASACGVIVKTREGRPVKLEGADEHPISQGALCAMGQASIQGLYHPERLNGPHIRHGRRLDQANWDETFAQITDQLKGKTKVGIFTGGSTGHSGEFLMQVLEKIGSSKDHLYTWEPNSLFSSIAKAHELAFGHTDLPRLELPLAKVIVGIGSDFLEVGTSPVYHTKGFSLSHSFKNGRKGLFVQLESNHSLTGSSADKRHIIKAGSETTATLLLVKSLFENPAAKGSPAARENIKAVLDEHSSALSNAYTEVGVAKEVFDDLANKLLKEPSVVVAGGSSNFDENATLLQLAAIMANQLTGAYGRTLQFEKGWMRSPVKPGDLQRFLKNADQLDALIVIESNPVFASPDSWAVKKAFEQIPLVISIQSFPNEVDDFAKFVLPNHHYLEAWGDEQSIAGVWSTRQPTVRSTTNSRQAEDILLWILAYMDKSLPYKDYQAYLKDKWRAIYDLSGVRHDYDVFFKFVLKRGFVGSLSSRTVSELKSLKSYFNSLPNSKNGFVLCSPLDHRLQDGRSAHLPVLQEIGDGLTTVAWDTWLAMNPKTMKKLGVKQNQVLLVESDAGSVKAAAYPLPGLHPDTIVIPRGNGHKDERSTISNNNGVNPLPVYAKKFDALSGEPVTSLQEVKVTPTGEWYRLAATQKQNDIANRHEIVKKYSLAHAKKIQNKSVDLDTVPDLFPKLEKATHHWGMSVDLDKCNGCGACMVACSLENNVPQVGREQILLGRTMHWIRLDRYFYGDIDNPSVTFQPVMCQHCNHAPCEAVCPVFATTHDAEGINSMTYNRCVGTRYCANACPYKVRRFNWWTHKWGTMGKRGQDRNPRALNPDVTVRTRGVMEKCSFCVGRLRDAKHYAKEQGRSVNDGEVKTACQQTCPTNAIAFGNLNDAQSKVSKERKNFRAYLMLGGDPDHGHYGIKTLPNVNYLAQITHEEPATGFGKQQGHGHSNKGH